MKNHFSYFAFVMVFGVWGICQAQNPNAFNITEDTSKTFAGLDLTSTSNPLVKTGSGTLTMTDSMGLFLTADGKFIPIQILEGSATFNVNHSVKTFTDITIGSATTATLDMGSKGLGDHHGDITVYNGSTLKIGSDTTLCDGGTFTFAGGGFIVGKTNPYLLLRNRVDEKATTFAVTGTNASALIDVDTIWLAEKNSNANGLFFDVANTNTLTIDGCMFDHSSVGAKKGFTKTGAGTLVLSIPKQDYSVPQAHIQMIAPITVSEGVLKLGSDNGVSTNVADLALAENTKFDLAGFDQTLAKISGVGNVTNTGVDASTLTLGFQKDRKNDAAPVYTSSTFAGTASGNVNLEIDAGTQTVTLAGANTYTGETTVASGTLKLGAAEVSGNFTNSAAPTVSTLTLSPENGTTSLFTASTGSGISVVANGNFSPQGAVITDDLTVNGTLVFDLDALHEPYRHDA